MISVSQLRELDLSALTEVAGNWRRAGDAAENARAEIDRRALPGLRTQQGATAVAARERLRLIGQNCSYTRAQCGLVEAALRGLAEALEAAKIRLRAALDEAAEGGYQVAEDGTVTYPATSSDDGTVVAEGGTARLEGDYLGLGVNPTFGHREKAQDLANRIGSALRLARSTDAEYAVTLARLETTAGLAVTGAMWVDAQHDVAAVEGSVWANASDLPSGQSPEQNREWWDGLTPAEQDTVVALFPEQIGAMDGLPAETRDLANRGVLNMEHGRVTGELAHHMSAEPGSDSDAWDAWDEERARLEGQLEGMRAIQDRFDQTGANGLPPAYLLGFSGDGMGRAIIANGNPDEADHTAVYVPGTGANLASAEKDITRAVDLWRASDSQAGRESVSTITWIGYDAPQTAIPFDGGLVPEAKSRDYAYAAAPLFEAFTHGLEVAQGGPDASHTTVIGHSYGSVVVGAAAKEGAVYTDDILAVGSPGMLVPHAADLGIGADHVWSMAAGTWEDQVPDSGRYFHGENNVGISAATGPWGLISIDIDLDVLPNVPSDADFGANIMKNDSDHHGGYWDHDSLSLVNQAQLIAGRYGEVLLE